jgi:hypothetical protein
MNEPSYTTKRMYFAPAPLPSVVFCFYQAVGTG